MEIRPDRVIEPQRETVVAKKSQVLVVGGSPTGVAAAVAAARAGADVLLVDRYGVLGGQTTVGLVFTHGKRLLYNGLGQRIVGGINAEMIRRALAEDGAESTWDGDDDWEWEGTWIDPEILKLLLIDMLDEAGVRVLLHTLVVGALVDNGQVRGVIVENASGRQAILAEVTVDATGDAEVAAFADAAFQTRGNSAFQPGLHALLGHVDIEQTLDYFEAHHDQVCPLLVDTVQDIRMRYRKGWSWGINGFFDFCKQALEAGILHEGDVKLQRGLGFLWMRGDTVQLWSINAGIAIDALNADDLTEAELRTRRRLGRLRHFYRRYVPGFAQATLTVTPTRIGIRETRQVVGEYTLTGEDVTGSVRFPDEIALCSGHDMFPHVVHGFGIPYRCLLPRQLDNLLVAGRCISAAAPTAVNAIRGIIGGVSTGEAAGTAAALAVCHHQLPRHLGVQSLQAQLWHQGVILDL